jgi:hypothetical protein
MTGHDTTDRTGTGTRAEDVSEDEAATGLRIVLYPT